jgi:3-oxoacyl-[acyl-carrier-protein] synthase II
MRIVITGTGAISPYGLGRDALIEGLESGQAAIRPCTLFSTTEQRTDIAGQAPTPPAAEHLPAREAQRLTRADLFALAAAREALEQAGLQFLQPDMGIFIGCSTGGMHESEQIFLAPTRPGFAKSLVGHQNSSPAEAVARFLQSSGPIEVATSACSAGTMAIEGALQALRSGEVDCALAGGADALCLLTYSGFNALRAVDTEASRPFRADREGLSLGEGAGVLVLETLEHALARGAQPLAELAGASSSCDAFHMTAPHPGGQGAAAAMNGALANAGIDASQVDFLNLHGTGTPHNDGAEWQAISRVFGERAGQLPATSTKGAIGHLLGACGGLEAVVTVLTLQRGRLHPTPGEGPVDPESPVHLVLGEARALPRCEYGLSTNLAFGGANAAALFRRWDGAQA